VNIELLRLIVQSTLDRSEEITSTVAVVGTPTPTTDDRGSPTPEYPAMIHHP
jgi:hypothetical protein